MQASIEKDRRAIIKGSTLHYFLEFLHMNSPTMSTKRRKCSGPSQESLVLDVLLEIVARTNVTTVIRFAATSRFLRRAILEPAFRRRLAADNDGFDPALLLGVSYRKQDDLRDVTTQRVVHSPAPTRLRARLDDDSLQAPYKPVASRDGLLVLRRYQERLNDKVELRACDAFTGQVTSLQPTTLPNACLHVVLSVDHTAGRSFDLLVADRSVRFYRTFSSKDGHWTDTRRVCAPHPNHQCDSSSSAVIGRTVYWPCRFRDTDEHNWNEILALDVDAGEATKVVLPPGCSKERLLLARVRGRLCFLVAQRFGIVMWTWRSPVARTWSRKVVINNLEIARQAGLGVSTYTIEGFGERSGVVILKLFNKGYLLRLDLGRRKEGTPVVTWLRTPENVVSVKELFLHEIDVVSLLQPMKHF